ncbi:hypothetical protein CL622_05320 [archaeon]|nr:hypothetical protein [archaeon]
MHVSVIEDIKTIFKDLGHQVDSKSISFHTWVFNRDADKVDVIGQHNWRDISPEMCDAFYERYKDELSDYDGFIVTYPPSFSLLFEKFNKPIIVVAATRYEAPFTNDITKWDQFNDFLRNKIDEGIIIPLANNLYDKKYCEHFTDREWNHISSLCAYTNLKYGGKKEQAILYDTCATGMDKNKINYIEPFDLQDRSWENIYDHKVAIHIPYNISTMTMFEQYMANMPLILPSLDLFVNIPGSLSQLYYGDIGEKNKEIFSSKESIKLADFYQWDWIIHYNDLDELSSIMNLTNFEAMSKRIQEENKQRKIKTYNSWKNVLDIICQR